MQIKQLAQQVKKKIALEGQSLYNVLDQFEENCIETAYFITKDHVENFIKLMKWNIQNFLLQINQTFKEAGQKFQKQDTQKIKQELYKQQKINQLMKQEVLQLNQLISDHLKSNEIKLKQKDNLIRRLQKQNEIVQIKVEDKLVQNNKKTSNQISIIDEDEPIQIQSKQKDPNELQIIIEEEELFSTSRIQPAEPQHKSQTDDQTELIIKYKTEPNQVFEEQIDLYDLDDIRAASMRKSSSKNKAKFFLNDFRKIIQTETDNPYCIKSKCSSKFASGESSQSRLSVARNQSQNINLPYRTSTPKKLFTKKKKQEAPGIKKTKAKVLNNSFFEQKNQKSKLTQRSNSFNLNKPKISNNMRGSSKENLKQKDLNIINISLTRPSSKQKLSLTLKPEHIKLRSSQDLSQRIPLKKTLEQEIYLLDLDIGQYQLSLHYNNRSGSNGNGVAYYDNNLKYQGSFKQNLRHGFGVLYCKNVEVYKGQWQRDKICGKGRLQNINFINTIRIPQFSILSQMIYIGQFEQNRLHGIGQLLFFSGDRIKTSFHDNRPEGGLQYINKYNQISHSRWYTDN